MVGLALEHVHDARAADPFPARGVDLDVVLFEYVGDGFSGRYFEHLARVEFHLERRIRLGRGRRRRLEVFEVDRVLATAGSANWRTRSMKPSGPHV